LTNASFYFLFSSMNLLYLHGLMGHPTPEKMAVLAEKATTVIAPQLDYYEHPDLFGWLLDELTLHKIDYIVGSSAGGLMGYWLARRIGCKALLFNPALEKMSMRPDILKHMADFVPTKPAFYDIVIGQKDDTIIPQTTIDFLQKNAEPTNYTLHFFPDLGHKIDLETFALASKKIIAM